MYVKLLGSLEIIVDRRSLDIGGPRQRTVLAMLALSANRVTSIDQLVDAVWDTNPPSTARGQVQTCISALRKLFAGAGRPDVIRTHPHGYLLRLSARELDSEQFSELLAEARRHTGDGALDAAATTLRRALGLWHGVALADVDSELVKRGAALLEDRYLSTLEERLRLDLALGRHANVIDELGALIYKHPLRERLYEYLMLALYRSGRPAESLEVARRARSVLAEELGIEPGTQLLELERAILNRQPSLDGEQEVAVPPPAAAPPAAERPAPPEPATTIPNELPFSIADFTGREDLIDQIKEVLTGTTDSSAPYAMRIVAISGAGGVGKSSLALRVAHELLDVFPDGHLYGDLQGAQDGDTGALLARFLRALGVQGAAIPDDLKERAQLYRSTVARSRVLVVLDAVTSEEQALPLLPGSPDCAVIVTSRMRLSGLPGAVCVDVEPFDTDKAVELLTKIVGAERVEAEPAAAAGLMRFCGGLPLALRIAGARLASRPHWGISQLVRRLGNEARRLDEFSHRGLELRASIGLTYRGLGVSAQRLFRLFGMLRGNDFPPWVAAALMDTDLADAGDLLESLVDARMIDVVEYPGQRVRYRYHDLIRVYAQERLAEAESPESRDAALGRVLGGWLWLADEAHRKEYGGDFTVLHGSAQRWRPASSGSAVAPGEAIDWWDTERDWWETERLALVAAIRQAADERMDEHCWDLALTAVTLFESKGYFELWRETAELGLDATTRAGNEPGRGAMLYSLGTLHMFQKRLTEAEECFRAALQIFDSGDNTHGRGLVLRNVALVQGLRGDTEAMVRSYHEGLAAMHAVGDRMGEAQILRSLAKFGIDEGDTERGRELLDQALAICREVNCLRGEAQVVHQFAHLYKVTGELDRSGAALRRVLSIVREIDDRIGETYALYGLGLVQVCEGMPAEAEQTLLRALTLARRVDERLIEGETLYALGELSLADGRTAVAAAHLTAAAQIFDTLGSAMWQARTLAVRSSVHQVHSDLDRAATDLDRAEQLLADLSSKEAARWRARVRSHRVALASARPAPMVGAVPA